VFRNDPSPVQSCLVPPNCWGMCPRLPQELDTGYRKIWDFGRTWDPDAYAAQSRGLSEIRRDLVLQRNWKASLDRMKTNMTVGCLQVSPLSAFRLPDGTTVIATR